MWFYGITLFHLIMRLNSQSPVLTPNTVKAELNSDVVLNCTLPSAVIPVTWWRLSEGDTSETSDLLVGLSGTNCQKNPATPPSYLECFCISDTKYTCTVKNIQRSDHNERWRCSVNDAMSAPLYSDAVFIYIEVGLNETCSNADPKIECSTANAVCSGTGPTCQCKTGYKESGSECKCPDCCCCDDKKGRDGACGAVLAVCICVMAVLCFLGYKGYHLGASLLLIFTVFLCICALCGFILNSICLSKECCSYNDECCEAKDCFKADTIAGFVMAGLSVLGLPVGILIFMNALQSGAGQK